MLALATLAGAAISITAPNTSLATVPVSYFGGNAMHRGDANIEMLAKMRMVIIEKWEGPCWTQCVEDKNVSACAPSCDVEQYIVGTLRRVKAANPKVACGFYLNTLLAFPFYAMTGELETHNATTIDSTTGRPIMIQNDQGEQNIPIFGYDTKAGREIYVNTVKNLVATGVVDGFFGDKWNHGAEENKKFGTWQICNKECGTVTPSQAQAWNEGKAQVLSNVTALVGDGFYLANGDDFDGVGSNFKGLKKWVDADPRDNIAWVAQQRSKHAYLWFTGPDQHWSTDPNSPKALEGSCTGDCLARFLLAVEEGCILSANGWADEYDYPLGNPTGPAVFDKAAGTLTRSFESGTKVVFTYSNVKKGEGSGVITWGHRDLVV